MNPLNPALAIRTIVFPTDGSAWAEHAFSQAAFFAATYAATVHVVTVRLDGSHEPLPGKRPHTAAPGPLSGTTPPVVVEATVAAETLEDGILEYAVHVDADLIVMATHGRRGVRRMIDGSVAEEVTRQAGCPVLTIRPEAPHIHTRITRILAAVDFSDASYLACAHAVALARLYGAMLDVVHVVEPQLEPGLVGGVAGWSDELPVQLEEAHTALVDFVEELETGDVALTCRAVMGSTVTSLVEAATRDGTDLIVVGSHGRTGMRRVLLGSVAEEVIRQAPCPVFVVKAFAKSLLRVPEAEKAVS